MHTASVVLVVLVGVLHVYILVLEMFLWTTKRGQKAFGMTEARAKVAQMQLPPDILTNQEAFRQFEQNQAQLTGALGRLLVVVEQYPELRSNQNFLALQSQLEGTENRISVARRDYIQAVQLYNTEIRTFPGRLWAMVYGAEPKANFTASEGAEQAPRVSF